MLRLLRLCLLLVIAACATVGAHAQSYSPPEYIYPSLLGTDGNLYGTGSEGMFELNVTTNVHSTLNSNLGSITLCSIEPGGSFLALSGTSVLNVTMAGVVTTLAALPYASICPVLANDGNYYGGDSSGTGTYNDGYLYQLTPVGKVTVLYNFTGSTDGVGPITPMLQGSDGNLYGVGQEYSTGGMFRFSAADGLTAYSSTEGISGPLYESSSGVLSAMSGTNLDAITLNGSVTSYPLALGNYGDDEGSNNGNFFLGGNGSLYLEEYYDYGEYASDDCGGNYLQVFSLSPSSGIVGTPFFIGANEDGEEEGSSYVVNEFLAGNGTFYGGYSDSSSSYNDEYGECFPSGTTYEIYGAPNSIASVDVSLSANRLIPGGSTTVSWNVNNAFADSLQQCYGYNGLSGKLAESGSEKLTFSQAGTYTPSVVCGGTQTGIAPLVVGGTQLHLAVSPATAIVGQPVTYTAYIENPGTPAPSGSVQFMYSGKVLATSSLNSSGVATLTASTSGLAPGNYTLTAKYPGNGNYTAATSIPITVTVSPLLSTATMLSTSTPTLIGGQTVSFSVSISNSNANYPPTGTVTLYLGTLALLSGKLSGAYPSTATLSALTAGVAPGTYSITAKYSGDAYNLPSTSSAVTVTVQKGVTITVSATPNPVPAGDSFTLSATVAGNSSTPTGTVIFSAGSQELSGANLMNGVATANIPADTLATGTYSITAAYAGDSKNPSGTSSPYSLTVQ